MSLAIGKGQEGVAERKRPGDASRIVAVRDRWGRQHHRQGVKRLGNKQRPGFMGIKGWEKWKEVVTRFWDS